MAAKFSKQKLICALFAVALTLTINITTASAVSFLGYTINITDTSEKTDFETINHIPPNTVGLINATYNGSKPDALIQVNVSYSTNAIGPWSSGEELLSMQPIPKGNHTSTQYTFQDRLLSVGNLRSRGPKLQGLQSAANTNKN